MFLQKEHGRRGIAQQRFCKLNIIRIGSTTSREKKHCCLLRDSAEYFLQQVKDK